MEYTDTSLIIEDKDLHIDRKTFVEIVNNQIKNDKILVGISQLGYCIRAKRDIKKGEVIDTFCGSIIPFEETKKAGEEECRALQIGPNKYINTEAPGRFVNHSCEPNAGITNDLDLIAIEDIPMHTEIRFDYSTTMDEDHYQMECKCGKPSCRKVVTDFKLLPEETRKRYLDLNIVMNFIKAQY